MKEALKDELKELLEKEDFGTIRPRASAIIKEYRSIAENEPVKQSEVIHSEDEEEPETKKAAEPDPVDSEMDALIASYNKRWREWKLKAKETEKQNLETRRELIREMKDLVENEENIGRAFARLQAIETKWKETGEVAKESYHDIQNEYSSLKEIFYYNIRIYKELQEHDLKKNYSLKNQVVHQMEELSNETSLNKLEKTVRELRNEWDEIGPTYQEHWEEIKGRYHEALRKVYDKISAAYDERKAQQQVVIDKKKALLEEIAKVIAVPCTSHKEWSERTEQVKAVQQAWKDAGFGPRKEEKQLWDTFRKECDKFFENKSKFYEERNQSFNEQREKKEALVKKAEELKDSTDWKETTQALIQLQKDWKKVGYAGPKFDQKLWNKFRKACDQYFKSKDDFFRAKEKELEGNVDKKRAIIGEMAAWKPESDDQDELLEQIKAFQQQFKDAGFLPSAQKADIMKQYQETLESMYKKLGLGDVEREMIVFRSYVQGLKGGQNAERELENEYRKIRKEASKLEEEIRQLETNLSFFGSSSKGSPMLDEFQQKIDNGKERSEILNQQMRYLRKAMA